MADLTEKQTRFCTAYIETGNASESYRRAYNSGGMADATINRKASELLAHGLITARLEELRKPAAEAAQLTLETHMRDLLELRNKATNDGKLDAAIKAEIARGRAAGLYSEKVELTGANGGSIKTEEIGTGWSGWSEFIGIAAQKASKAVKDGRAIDTSGGKKA